MINDTNDNNFGLALDMLFQLVDQEIAFEDAVSYVLDDYQVDENTLITSYNDSHNKGKDDLTPSVTDQKLAVEYLCELTHNGFSFNHALETVLGNYQVDSELLKSEYNNLNHYIFPIDNYFGGNGWKMPVHISTGIDLISLKSKDMESYINTMLVVFKKLSDLRSFTKVYEKIKLILPDFNSELDCNYYDHQTINVCALINSSDLIQVLFQDDSGVQFIVNEPVLIGNSILVENLPKFIDSFMLHHECIKTLGSA